MRMRSTKPERAKLLKLWVQSAMPEGAKRPNSPTGLAWRGIKWLARLVYDKSLRERSDWERECEAQSLSEWSDRKYECKARSSRDQSNWKCERKSQSLRERSNWECECKSQRLRERNNCVNPYRYFKKLSSVIRRLKLSPENFTSI